MNLRSQLSRLTRTALALPLIVLGACSGGSDPQPVAATVEVTPAQATRNVGETVQLSAAVKDAGGDIISGKQVLWSTSAAAIATVNTTGLVTGVADGIATITAAVDGKSGSASVTIIGPCSTELATNITVGQTINGALATTDCRLEDGSYADGYAIAVATATSVQIDLTSAAFDTWLVLFELLQNGTLAERAVNDDADQTTTNSRITFTLNPGAEYFILANSFDPAVTGAYQLKVLPSAGFVGRSIGIMKPGKPPASVLLRAIRPR